jgi:carboxylesterase type B
MGESAGGIAICNLLGCPRAKGLFRRAIVQSAGVSIWSKAFYEETVRNRTVQLKISSSN